MAVPEGASAPETPHATLALFAYSDVKPDTADCVIRELRTWSNLVYARISNDALIDRSRSRMASDYLRSKRENVGDVLLMVDHDMKWEHGDLTYLAEKTLETKGIVAGVYSKRGFGEGTAVRFAAPGRYTIGEDVLAPAQYVSTGFVGIHRVVLEKMAETLPMTIGNFWPFFLPMLASHPMGGGACEYLSEDWAFCARASDLKFPIHAALKPRLTHIGETGYRIIDSQATPPPDQTVTFNVEPPVDIPVIKWMMRDVAEYTNISPDGIHRAITNAREGLAKLWHDHGSHEPVEENRWYRRGDVGRHNLLDLAGWHTSTMGTIMVENLSDIKGKRVLDFGSGIGTMAIMLAAQDNEVDCIEVNDELRKFAEWRSKHCLNGEKPLLNGGRSLRFVDVPTGDYDMVIAWHVFEHLPNPENKLKELVAALKPGGRMWSQSDWVADTHHPFHHERDREKWEEEMVGAGLKPVEDSPCWYEKV